MNTTQRKYCDSCTRYVSPSHSRTDCAEARNDYFGQDED
jgi:hypothetical protein